MFDKIKEISGSDVVEFFGRFGKFFIELDDSSMNSDNSINDNVMPLLIFLNRVLERLFDRVDDSSKLFGNLH